MTENIKTYKINLDLPPERRWSIIFDAFEDKLQSIKPILKSIIDVYIQNYSFIFKCLVKSYRFFKKIMYEKELHFFAEKLDIDFEYILMLQLIYESSSCCTSVVSKVDNNYVMFRTMDWPMDFLTDITVNLEFVKNNKTLFYATSWIGYVGILTATIPDKCSIAVNYRRTQDMSFTNILKNVFQTMLLKYPIGYLIRDICENETYIDIIKNRLYHTQLISPCYITLCYTNKYPEIITRDPNSYKSHTHEYVIQTNCDIDKQIPDILYSVARRKYALQSISNVSNKYESIETMKSELLQYPILNDETLYVTMMSPNLNVHLTNIDL